jgi:hypothetical protein
MIETEKHGTEAARPQPAYAHLDDGIKALDAAQK